MLKRIKTFLNQHKFPIVGGIFVLVGGWYFTKALTDETSIKLSSFIQAVKRNYVQEVIIEGSSISFKSAESDWYTTYAENYPLQQLFQLFKYPFCPFRQKDIIFKINDATFPKEAVHFAIASLLSLFTVKYMMSEMQKPEISNTSI